jgi:hypothetical protein
VSQGLDALVPELQPYAKELIRLAGVAGLLPKVTSTRRSHRKQVALYVNYLRGNAKYPTAFPGTSAHEYGEAFDVLVTPYDMLDELGALWQEWGGTWGARADPIHFELPGASQSHRIGPSTHTVAQAADFLLGFAPYLGEVELVASLLKLGFPKSEVLDFLSGPLGYLTK